MLYRFYRVHLPTRQKWLVEGDFTDERHMLDTLDLWNRNLLDGGQWFYSWDRWMATPQELANVERHERVTDEPPTGV